MKSEFNISELGKQGGIELSLDENTPWLKDLLDELCEGLTVDDYEQGEEIPSISFEGLIKKEQDDKVKDFVILEGQLNVLFYTLCVKSGTVITDQIEASIDAAFIHSAMKEQMGLDDEVDIFLLNKEFELYYLEKGKADIKPVLSELAFVNKNPYPSLES